MRPSAPTHMRPEPAPAAPESVIAEPELPPWNWPLVLTLPLCLFVFIAASLQGLAIQPSSWLLAQQMPDLGSALLVLLPLLVLVLLLLLAWFSFVRIVFRRSLPTARCFVLLVLAWSAAGVFERWLGAGLAERLGLSLWLAALLGLLIALCLVRTGMDQDA